MADDRSVDDGLPVRSAPGLGWFARRAAIGLAVLVTLVIGMAWLTHTAIEADSSPAIEARP